MMKDLIKLYMQVHGASRASMKMVSWCSFIDLLVEKLDDFHMVIGINFLSKNKKIIVPLSGSMVIANGSDFCFVYVIDT